jgi:hypothetical protein
MYKKRPLKSILFFIEIFFVGLLFFICTCDDAPLNPYTCSSCSISLMLRSSTLTESELQIQDTPTKCFQMVAKCFMTSFMDSVKFQLINEQHLVDKDTIVRALSKSTGVETVTFNTSLSAPGVRVAKVIAYLKECQPISDSATVIIATTLQNTKPEISIAGSTIVPVNALCTLNVNATDAEQINAQLVYDISDLPAGATFKDQRFIWKPSQADTYPITFIATDNGIPPLTAVKTVNLVVYAIGIVKSDGTPLKIRNGPGVDFDSIGTVADGSIVKVYTQAYGSAVMGTNNITSNIWDHIDGGYVSDVYVYTGSDGLVAPLESR